MTKSPPTPDREKNAPLTEADLRHIAKLARLRIRGSDLKDMTRELEEVRRWVAHLQEVDTKDIDLTEGLGAPFDKPLPRREDKVEKTNREDILKNAPDEREGFFSVPKVVE